MKHEEQTLREELAQLAPLLSAYDRSRMRHPQPPAGYWEEMMRRARPAPALRASRHPKIRRLVWVAAASLTLSVGVWSALRFINQPSDIATHEVSADAAIEYLIGEEVMRLDGWQLEALLSEGTPEEQDAAWRYLLDHLTDDEIQSLF